MSTSSPQDGFSSAAEFDERCAAWLQSMDAGEEAALGELYEATIASVFGVAVRIVGDSTAAEDVVADVYHEAWQSAGRYDRSRGRPITWLMTICRNRALDMSRREYSSAQTHRQAASLVVQDEGERPDELLEAIEARHMIRSVIEQLGPEDRQLVAMAFFKGFTHQQIADCVELPLGTIKSRIRRALIKLGDAMQTA